MDYLVKWEIEIDADSPREAAQKALAIQRDPNSIATVFAVENRANEWESETFDLNRGHHPACVW